MATKKQEKNTERNMAIPLALKDSIGNLGLSGIMKAKATRLCCILIWKGINEQKDICAFQKLSTQYFQDVFGKSFNKGFFNRLISEGVVECDRMQEQSRGIPFGYRINIGLYEGEWTTVPCLVPSNADRVRPVQRTYVYDRQAANRIPAASGSDIPKRPSGNSDEPVRLFSSSSSGSSYLLPPLISTSSSLHINTLIFQRPSRNPNEPPGPFDPGRSLTVFSTSHHSSCSIDTSNPYLSSVTSSSSLTSSPTSSLHINTLIFANEFLTADMRSLAYGTGKLKECCEKAMAAIRADGLVINDLVEDGSFKVDDLLSNKSYYTTRDKAISHARDNGCALIRDGRRFVIDDPGRYVARKRKNVAIRYRWCITMVEQGIFYAARNETNRRLDHNFTSMPSVMLGIIKEDNDLAEIDMKNAQFAIHARWLIDEGLDLLHEDVSIYCKICAEGILYEHLGELFRIQRNEAKTLMLGIAFSSHRHSSEHKRMFRELFPNVLAHIDGFKREKGKSGLFAVELQLWESEIFIDNIFINIREQGLFCITKHDSVIVREKDVEVVIRIMTGCFQSIGFGCVLNVEGRSVVIERAAAP